jgi:hypothetical protein
VCVVVCACEGEWIEGLAWSLTRERSGELTRRPSRKVTQSADTGMMVTCWMQMDTYTYVQTYI